MTRDEFIAKIEAEGFKHNRGNLWIRGEGDPPEAWNVCNRRAFYYPRDVVISKNEKVFHHGGAI